MDTPSSSHDGHHVAEQVQQQVLPIQTTKSLPYHSLLLELHTLDPEDGIWSTLSDLPLTRQDMLTLRQEVKLQQMIFMLLQNHGLGSESLVDIQTMVETEAEQIQELEAAFTDDRGGSDITDYGVQCRSHLTKFLEISSQEIKPRVKEFCLEIVDRLLQDRSSTTGDYGIFRFINVILLKLKDFMNLKPNLIDPVKKQMQILEHMLSYAPIIARKMTNLDENLQNFLELFEPWVNTAAAIVIPYWVDEYDEMPFSTVSSSLHKFNLNIQRYVKAFILVIKALRPSNASEILVMRNTVEQFIEIILENFIVSTDDQFDVFREGLAFWMALVVDPPKSDAEHEKLICSQTHLLLHQAESLICSMCLDKDVAERRNNLLSDFLEKINKAKAEVRQLRVHQIPGLSLNNAPKENTRRCFDLLLGNLQKKFEVEAGFLPFEKHLISIVHKELSLLRPYLMDMFEVEDERKELSDICVQASSIAYIVDHVTDFCLASADIPIWSNLMHLSNAKEKIQSIKSRVSKIRQNDQMYNNIVMSAKSNSQLMFPTRQEDYDETIKDDFIVGFVEEKGRIIDFLVAGEAGRDIVAVVGMGGQGKTHLAQRVFHDECIKSHFHKRAWCCISQAFDIKKVFRDILEGVGEILSPVLYQSLTQEDLAAKLRQCLMKQKYLIVLDDMWDAKTWFDLQLSFPDDRNGSRIVLTSRNADVALKIKADCSIIELHPLSPEESWNLLQMKVFHGDYCPPTLFPIGKTVAKNCKGLPLAVVVVAGLLKNDKTVESWNQISESLKPLIASEGCLDILELSYKQLPDYLKLCFLYVGVFKEDQIIDAKQLIQFWIAEGIVQSDGIKTKEVVANEYLMDLVSRSLIFVDQRSSRNGIKTCFVHDLLHQVCHIKVKEERFFLLLNDISSNCILMDLLDHSSEVSGEPSYILNLGGSHCSFTLQNDVSYCSLPLVVEGRSRHSLTLNDGHCRIVVGDNCHLNAAFHFQPLLPGLRSFIDSFGWLDYPELPIFLKKLKLIRVLDLPNVEVTKTCFDCITQLIHLRLLAFVCNFPIPPSIVNLLKLEVLRFYASFRLMNLLPSAVTKMPSLRHIIARECRFDYMDSYDQLVPDMSSSPLSNLETLTSVYFDDELSFKRVAQSLQNVLKLGFYCGVCFRLSGYFKRLQSLKFHIRSHWRQDKVIICPSTLNFPLTLKELNLKVYGLLSSAMMSLIGKLSNLEVLKLNAKLENDKWDVEDDEFLKLKYFYFKSSSIQEWDASDESFPRLQQLLVRKCLQLRELPARFGSVTTLKRIELQACSNSLSNSFQQIVEDQKDAGNKGLQHSIS